MLPHGMKHSKELDAKLSEEAVQRAYADPTTLHIEGEKGEKPKYIPEDLDEYAWLLNGRYILRAAIFAVVLGVLALGWMGVGTVITWYKEEQEFYKNNPQKCGGGGPASYFCAEKDTIHGTGAARSQ